MKHLRYLGYLARHKWWVLVEGLRLKVPLRRLLVHDLSKFFPPEYNAYCNRFYGRDYDVLAWELAHLHHVHTNDHHWQHWVLSRPDGTTVTVRMPEAVIREMIADWKSVGRCLGKPDARQWYRTNHMKLRLHPDTRKRVEALLGIE